MAMANHEEEARPLLSGTPAVADEKLPKPTPPVAASAPLVKANPAPWTADGLPVSHGSVIGEPAARAQWDSSLFACLGRNDEFCSSDLEVCTFSILLPCGSI